MDHRAKTKVTLFSHIREKSPALMVVGAFRALQFIGASASDMRGVSDTGLNEDELTDVLGYLVDAPDGDKAIDLVGELMDFLYPHNA